MLEKPKWQAENLELAHLYLAACRWLAMAGFVAGWLCLQLGDEAACYVGDYGLWLGDYVAGHCLADYIASCLCALADG